MSPSAVKFEAVGKSYKSRNGPIEALKKLDLEVPAGQIYGFAGPNGAGKSTSIKILVGLIRPDSGSATIFDHPSGSKEAKNLVGFLPEVTLYHEFMSAQELLKIHANLAGVERKEIPKRCERALERVGLADRSRSRLKEFSKGMKQRFGIAQAIVGEPKLLVLDELTSGLDPIAQASLLNLLSELREQGLTIFFSSHHLREIEKICDSVAILNKGELKCSGTLDSVLGDVATVRIKLYLKPDASPPERMADWKKEADGGYVGTVNKGETRELLRSLDEVVESVHSVDTRRKTLEELFEELTAEPAVKEPA